jgi:transposase
MSKQKPRHFSHEQKIAILREHLIEHKTVSDICERHQMAPSVFYEWQRKLFENGVSVFEKPGKTSSREQELAVQVELLKAKVPRREKGRTRLHSVRTSQVILTKYRSLQIRDPLT